MASNMWTSNERLYLNSKGEVVGADDPDRQSLLVGEGGAIPVERARELGLVEVQEQQVKAAAPAQNKARQAAPENKAAASEGDAEPKARARGSR